MTAPNGIVPWFARWLFTASLETPVEVGAGAADLFVELAPPPAAGKYELRAIVDGAGARFGCPVQSRRRVTIAPAAK